MKNSPKAITFPQYPSITALDDDGEEEGHVYIGDIAEQYSRKFTSRSGTDKTFGLRHMNGTFYIGNKKSKITENNIIIGEKEYAGTPGLWEVIVATTPDDNIFTNGNYDNYAKIMYLRYALVRNNDEGETKPKANTSWKWMHILKQIWKYRCKE